MKQILNCLRLEQIKKENINQSALERYLAKADKHESLSNCWFDLVDEVFFGPLENYSNTKSYDSLHLTEKERFLENERHGLPYFINLANNGYQSSELVIDDEFIYEKTKYTSSVKGKSVFVIGAGPSSGLVNVEEISKDYDEVWVCNDYRKHESIKNIKPDLFYISNELYNQNETLDFLRNNKNITCAMDINVNRNPIDLNAVKVINKENNLIFSLRMFTSSGVMPRLIALAVHMGASRVGFVGLDGYSREHYKKGVYESAFEGGTKNIANSNFNYRSQCREFILFWDYIVNIVEKKVQFINYGKEYEHNITKEILEFI